MYRLIATDLDGTLLDDQGQMPAANLEYIKKAMDSGVQVALCSGRSFVSLNVYERELGLDKKGCYGISFNGGIVYDAHSGEILSDIRMPLATALELIEQSRRIISGKAVDIMVYSGAELYVEDGALNENTKVYADRSHLNRIAIKNFNELSGDPTKILLKGSTSDLVEIEKDAMAFTDGKCKMFFTSPVLLEMIPLDSGKDRGLQILAERLGIPIAETIAVGDQVNDVSMIRAAGLGIAVSNAVDAAKAVAGYVTETDNNAGVFREIVTKFVM